MEMCIGRLCWSQELQDLEERLRAHFAQQQREESEAAAERGAPLTAFPFGLVMSLQQCSRPCLGFAFCTM